jgi:hypothetical protein
MKIEILISFIAFSLLVFCYSYLLKEAELLQIANEALKNFVELNSKEFFAFVGK